MSKEGRPNIVKVETVPGLNADQFSRIQGMLKGQGILFDTGHVILSGTDEQIQASEAVLRALPATESVANISKPAMQTVSYTVTLDNAAATASAVKDLTGASVSIVGTNLIVRGTTDQQKDVSALMSSVMNKAGIKQTVENAVKRSYPSNNPQGDKEVLEALLDVKVTALLNQRLIVVQASESQQKAVTSILQDRKATLANTNISYYPVNTGQATDLIPALRRELPDADIQVVTGRNILSVQASSSDQARVVDILSKIQSAPIVASADQPITRSIKLGYGDADAMVSNLSNLKTPSTVTPNMPGNGTPATATAQTPALSMFADKRTNSVIISGPRAAVEEMAQAIANIDTPEQGVRVRLRVEQVNLSDIQNLGIDWKLGIGSFNLGQSNGNLSVGYAPTLAPASISATLKTNKNHGNTRTVIDSNFAALSGQSTNFSSGGELLFPASTSVVNGATVNNPGQTYKYGLDIKVTPRIAPDGTVVMTMDTDLGSTPATGPQSSIQQTKQTMSSTVMLKRGETVVLGGIVTNTVDTGRNGIPGLMDIPVLGALFGNKSNTNSNTALLFIVSADTIQPTSINTTNANGTQRTEVGIPAVAAQNVSSPAATPAPVSAPAAVTVPVTPALPTTAPADTTTPATDNSTTYTTSPAPDTTTPATPAPVTPAPATPGGTN